MQIKFSQSIEPMVKKLGHSGTEVGKGMRYTLSDSKVGKDVYTRSANSCTAFVVNSGEHNLMGHIDPRLFNRRTFLDKFRPMLDSFLDKFGEAKAVITGGWEVNRHDSQVRTSSCEVYSAVAEALDELPLTMICGKKNGVRTFDNLLASGDKITLSNEAFEKLGLSPDKIKSMKPEEIESVLQKAYEWVEIDPSML